jgi:hypothetical protein
MMIIDRYFLYLESIKATALSGTGKGKPKRDSMCRLEEAVQSATRVFSFLYLYDLEYSNKYAVSYTAAKEYQRP